MFVGRQVVWEYVCGQTGNVGVCLWADSVGVCGQMVIRCVWEYACGQTVREYVGRHVMWEYVCGKTGGVGVCLWTEK